MNARYYKEIDKLDWSTMVKVRVRWGDENNHRRRWRGRLYVDKKNALIVESTIELITEENIMTKCDNVNFKYKSISSGGSHDEGFVGKSEIINA